MPINLHWKIMWTTLFLVCFIISLTALGYVLIRSHYFDSVWQTTWVLSRNAPDLTPEVRKVLNIKSGKTIIRNIKPDETMTWRFYNFFPNKRIIFTNSFGINSSLAMKEDGVGTRSILERYKDQPICSVIIEGKGYKEKYTCDSVMELRRQGDHWKYKDLKSQEQIQELSSDGVGYFILPKGYYSVTVMPNVNFIRKMIAHDDRAGFHFTIGAYRWFDFPEKKALELFGKRKSVGLCRFVAGDSRMLHEFGQYAYLFAGKTNFLILPIAWFWAIITGFSSVFFGIIFLISFKRRLRDVYKNL